MKRVKYIMKQYHYGNPDAQMVLIQLVGEHDLRFMEQEIGIIKTLTDNADFDMIAVKVDDWNNDLSPWAAPPVFGKEPFGDGAKATLDYLQREIISSFVGRSIYLGGYSLAGLFALWAAYQTDVFSGVAAVSPSVWFPRFEKYAMSNPIKTKAVYLSLGDKEEKTRNPVMAQVGNAICSIYQHLSNSRVNCTLEWNEGNHFREPDMRIAKGFAWLIYL